MSESAKSVVFSFYAGELFRIVVDYDRYETEGVTDGDFVEAISAAYGPAAQPAVSAKVGQGYGEAEEFIAHWQDPQYRFDLLRFSYGPTFKLVGASKQLEAPAQAYGSEAARRSGSSTERCGPTGKRSRSRKSQVGQCEACEQAEVSTVAHGGTRT